MLIGFAMHGFSVHMKIKLILMFVSVLIICFILALLGRLNFLTVIMTEIESHSKIALVIDSQSQNKPLVNLFSLLVSFQFMIPPPPLAPLIVGSPSCCEMNSYFDVR